MMYIRYTALLFGAVFLSYFTGVYVEKFRCDTRIANTISDNIIQNTNLMEQTNEMVFHTGVGDVRRILREKYTIAD